MADESEVAKVAKSSPLVQRLARRQTEPVGMIDVRSFQSQYARIPGWFVQRFAWLNQLQQRYSSADATPDGTDLVLTVPAQVSARQQPESWGPDLSQQSRTSAPNMTKAGVARSVRVSRQAVPLMPKSVQRASQPSAKEAESQKTKDSPPGNTEPPAQTLMSQVLAQPTTELIHSIQTKAIAQSQELPPPRPELETQPLSVKSEPSSPADSPTEAQLDRGITKTQQFSVVRPSAIVRQTGSSQALILPKRTSTESSQPQVRLNSAQPTRPELQATGQTVVTQQAPQPMALPGLTVTQPHPAAQIENAAASPSPSSSSSAQLSPSSSSLPLIQRQSVSESEPSEAVSVLRAPVPPTALESVSQAAAPSAMPLSQEPIRFQVRSSLPSASDQPLQRKIAAVLPSPQTDPVFSQVAQSLPLVRAHSVSIALRSADPSAQSANQANVPSSDDSQEKTTLQPSAEVREPNRLPISPEISIRPNATLETRMIWRKQAQTPLSAPAVQGNNHASLPFVQGWASSPGNRIARQTATGASATGGTAVSAGGTVPSTGSTPPTPSQALPINIAQLAEQVSRILSRQLMVERERRGINLW